jgi:hypothetical protein
MAIIDSSVAVFFYSKAIKAEVSSELVTDFANIIFSFAC